MPSSLPRWKPNAARLPSIPPRMLKPSPFFKPGRPINAFRTGTSYTSLFTNRIKQRIRQAVIELTWNADKCGNAGAAPGKNRAGRPLSIRPEAMRRKLSLPAAP